jgi:hypothetical protein
MNEFEKSGKILVVYIILSALLFAIFVSMIVGCTKQTNIVQTVKLTTEPTIEHTEPTIEPTIPTTESTEPITEPTEITSEPTEPVTEPQPWWTEEELDMLAALIYYEAGSNDCTDRHQQLVGQVVINRMNDDRFPNTIHDVIIQNGQYSTYKLVLGNMGGDFIPQRCYTNAMVVLNDGVECPPNVIYQANFKQGTKIYEEHYTSYSTTYFCHG